MTFTAYIVRGATSCSEEPFGSPDIPLGSHVHRSHQSFNASSRIMYSGQRASHRHTRTRVRAHTSIYVLHTCASFNDSYTHLAGLQTIEHGQRDCKPERLSENLERADARARLNSVPMDGRLDVEPPPPPLPAPRTRSVLRGTAALASPSREGALS